MLTDAEISKKIGNKIGFYRNERTLSQEKLAELVGVERNTITRYENGQSLPKITILMRIAKDLQVQIPDLLPDLMEV